MQGGQGGQARLAEFGEEEALAAVVGRVGATFDEAAGFGPVDELYGRVVPQFQRVGNVADGGGLPGARAPDG